MASYRSSMEHFNFLVISVLVLYVLHLLLRCHLATSPPSVSPFPSIADINLGDAPSRADLGLPEDAFVFASFNYFKKLSQAAVDAWMAILRKPVAGLSRAWSAVERGGG